VTLILKRVYKEKKYTLKEFVLTNPGSWFTLTGSCAVVVRCTLKASSNSGLCTHSPCRTMAGSKANRWSNTTDFFVLSEAARVNITTVLYPERFGIRPIITLFFRTIYHSVSASVVTRTGTRARWRRKSRALSGRGTGSDARCDTDGRSD